MSKLRKFAVHKDNALVRLMIMLLVPVMLIATVSMTAYAQSGYVIYDGEERRVIEIESRHDNPPLMKKGLEDGILD